MHNSLTNGVGGVFFYMNMKNGMGIRRLENGVCTTPGRSLGEKPKFINIHIVICAW